MSRLTLNSSRSGDVGDDESIDCLVAVDLRAVGPHIFFCWTVALAEEDLDDTNVTADRVAAWLSLLRRSINAAIITAGIKRIDAISPPRNSATIVVLLVRATVGGRLRHVR